VITDLVARGDLVCYRDEVGRKYALCPADVNPAIVVDRVIDEDCAYVMFKPRNNSEDAPKKANAGNKTPADDTPITLQLVGSTKGMYPKELVVSIEWVYRLNMRTTGKLEYKIIARA